MSLRIVGTYNFEIRGDSISNAISIPLRALKNPSPIKDDYIPSGFISANATPGNLGVTPTLEGEFLTLVFTSPPPSAPITQVTVVATFGVDRV